MGENIRLALKGIWSHRLRSFLTMLGVIIGIASIIAIVSTIKGTNEQIMQNLIGAGNNNVTISLIDDAGTPGPSWNLINAWPVGYTVPDLNGMGGEVAIQSLELCHEGLEATMGSAAGEPSPI